MKTELIELLKTKAKEVAPEFIAVRETLHQHPELSFEEYKTMEFVANELSKIGIPFQKGIVKTGIVGFIKTPTCEKWIALRADLDALPIQEENDVAYRSQHQGIMHACGHDVHTSVLLGTAKILWELRNELPYSIKLIFQPGEEKNPGGASLMIAEGVLENPKVEAIYGLHVFPEMNVGKVGLRSGLYMASSDEIHLEINGKGGHGALPEKCVNPILMGCRFINLANKRVKELQPEGVPCVLSFGHFESIGATNVIPSHAKILGTFRTMNEDFRTTVHLALLTIAEEVSLEFGGEIQLTIPKGYPFLKNDNFLTENWRKALKTTFSEENVEELALRMTAEDFAFYSQKIPASFGRLGVADPNKAVNYSVHHPKFDIHSDAIENGILMLLSAVFSA